MMENYDLKPYLQEWPYEEKNNVRFFSRADGREIMQIRRQLGIDQYEIEGRPDGLKPLGKESFLEIYTAQQASFKAWESDFVLDAEDLRHLREESFLYHFRSLAFFQLKRYPLVILDTQHNLDIGRLVEKYYFGEGKDELLQYWPYIRRFNALAKGMLALSDDNKSKALQELHRAYWEIQLWDCPDTHQYKYEQTQSLRHLSEVIEQINQESKKEKLNNLSIKQLKENLAIAVEKEEYETAAALRDKIKRTRSRPLPNKKKKQ